MAHPVTPHRPGLGHPTSQSADLLGTPAPLLNGIILVVALFVVTFLVWAANAPLDEIVTGQGKVIPSTKLQLVQNLEGGIVREIAVHEGKLVRAGDLLLRIDPTGFGSNADEQRERIAGFTAVSARLRAEMDGKPLRFPADLAAQRPDFVHEQAELFEARAQEQAAAVAALEFEAAQKRQEILENSAKQKTLARALDLVRQELALIEPLALRGSAPKAELIKAQAQVNELEGNLDAVTLSLPRMAAALAEIERHRLEKISGRRAQALTELSEAQVQLAALTQSLRGQADKVDRTEVRAPVDGVVKTMHVNTIGPVIKPGGDLVEIVPANDTLLVEARIRPQDVGFLRPGLDAVVKVTAYDFPIFGSLKGKLEQIGADTVITEKGEAYYAIQVRTDKNHLEKNGEVYPIMPGMVTQVNLLTGRRTVLSYLTKPIHRVRDSALTER